MSERTAPKRPLKVEPCALCGYHAPGAAMKPGRTGKGCPHCGRNPLEPSLRKPLRGPFSGVVEGLFALPRGLFYLLSTRGLKRWLVPPLIVTSVFLLLALVWTFGVLDAYIEERTTGTFEVGAEWPWLAGLSSQWDWLKDSFSALVDGFEWVANLLIGLLTSGSLRLFGWFLVGSLVSWYCFSIAYEALAGPFLDEIQSRLESRWFGADPRNRLERPTDIPADRCVRLSTWVGTTTLAALVAAFFVDVIPGWSVLAVASASTLAAVLVDRRYGSWLLWVARVEGRAAWVSLQASVITGVLLLFALPLYFVPLLGYFMFAFVCGFATAIGMLDIPMERRGWPLGMRVRFILRNLPALVTFGIVGGALLAIPIFGPIFMVPGASIGGLWLLCRLDKSKLST